jgi:hypothetical protein
MFEDDDVDFVHHDSLERDHDERYEYEPVDEDAYYPDPDAEYENRYDLGDY